MGSVTVSREKAAWRDRVRAYDLKVDGGKVGSVKSGSTLTVPLTPGTHIVRMTIDWCSSKELSLDGSMDHQLFCKAGGSSRSAILDILFGRNEYISLERA